MVAVDPSCSSWSTSMWTSARLSSERPMLSTEPTGEPPISTWLSGTSWPAFWNTRVYLCPPPPLKKTTASTITATARAAITAIRAGVVPRLAAGFLSSPTGLAATDSRLLSSSPVPPIRQNSCQMVSEGVLAKTRLSRDLTGNQRVFSAALDAQFRDRSRQRLRQPPNAVAEQEHQRRQED